MSFTSLRKSTTPSPLKTPVFIDAIDRYLLDQSSGPFIDRCLAHQQIAFSCISYLNSNLDLIPSTIEEKTQSVLETLIINRYNGLHQYSNKFWIDHVLAYLRAGGKISSCKYLAQAFKQFMTVRRKIEPSSIAISPSGIIPLRQENRGGSDLLVCCEDACLSDMLEQVTRFRKILRTKEYTFESPLCEFSPVPKILYPFLLILTDIPSTYEVGERQ